MWKKLKSVHKGTRKARCSIPAIVRKKQSIVGSAINEMDSAGSFGELPEGGGVSQVFRIYK